MRALGYPRAAWEGGRRPPAGYLADLDSDTWLQNTNLPLGILAAVQPLSLGALGPAGRGRGAIKPSWQTRGAAAAPT